MTAAPPRASSDPKGPAPRPADVADYSERMSRELGDMARKADLDMLVYLLNMVREEAAETAKRKRA